MNYNSSTVLHPLSTTHSTKISFFSEFLLMTTATFVFAVYFKLGKNGKKGEKTNQINVSSLPGPKYLIPFVGNILQLSPFSNTINVLKEWCGKYGPLIKIHLGGYNFVILNSASSVEAILKSNHPGHIAKFPRLCKEMETYLPSQGLLFSNGQEWKYSRKILSRSMSIQSLRHSMPKVNKHCSRLVDKLKLLFQDKKPHAINTMCRLALFDVIGELITGLDLHGTTDGQRILGFVTEAEEIILQKTLRPWITLPLIWNFHPYSKRQQAVVDGKDEICANVIHRRRQERAERSLDSNQSDIPTHEKTIVDLLLDSNMNDTLIADEILLMFIAGYDTTASSFHFFCFLMALHPEFQANCRKEIKSVLGDRHEVTWEDVDNLKYLEQCICESMRLYPIVTGTIRTLGEPLVLDEDQVLPVGTNVLVLPSTIHRDPNYFPNPDEYDPGRFTPEEIAKRPIGSYIPFLLGPRNCLGFKFAMIELKVVAAYVLRNFELSTEHTIDEIPVLPTLLLKPERDYIFSFKPVS